MEALKEKACKTANKVSLNMQYGETTGQRDHAGQINAEAFAATSDLLELIDPVELRERFEQFHHIFSKSNSKLIEDPIYWSKFVATQCDLLHEVRLHQKTIASVGDDLAKWDRQPVSNEKFGSALNGMVGLVTGHAALLSRAIEQQAGRESDRPRHALSFSHAVCGLTIVLLAIGQSIEQGDPHDEDCAAIATFGACLTVSNVQSLCQACELAAS